VSEPTFVDGIGPPLEQIQQDCYERLGVDDGKRSERDILALIAEVKKLRRELARECSLNEHARAETAEAEVARLNEVVAAKDELLMAYRLGSHRKADSALAKLEKLEARRITMPHTGKTT